MITAKFDDKEAVMQAEQKVGNWNIMYVRVSKMLC